MPNSGLPGLQQLRITGTAYSQVAAGIAGAVGEEDAVGLCAITSSKVAVAGEHGDLGRIAGQVPEDVSLEP
jgi:hypothetical protein